MTPFPPTRPAHNPKPPRRRREVRSFRRPADQLTHYRFNGLGNLTRQTDALGHTTRHAYDAQGNRVETYDTANRLSAITFTKANETWDLAYDPAGRLIRKTRRGDGASTQYTWDARGRLKEISGSNGAARFDYDALGRRVTKTVNGQTTGYLHDGEQVVAELQGNRLGALYLTGLGIDEALARITPTGIKSQITDALGGVMAELNAAGEVTTSYAYSPYGETTVTGEASNTVQYTARENDGAGLYYYRARYYDPQLKRFISEDPIGLEGGFNSYAYVNGNPLMYTEPDGLCRRGYKQAEGQAEGVCEPDDRVEPDKCALGGCTDYPDSYNCKCMNDCMKKKVWKCIRRPGMAPICYQVTAMQGEAKCRGKCNACEKD